MKLKLHTEQTYNGCQKPGCLATRVYRHHRGGEHTFVRHFAWMRFISQHKDRYKELCTTYHEFRAKDIVMICGDHHEEVHNFMESFDLDWMVENDCIKAFHNFTWRQAKALMAARRQYTDQWLKRPTPGIKERRFTGYE